MNLAKIRRTRKSAQCWDRCTSKKMNRRGETFDFFHFFCSLLVRYYKGLGTEVDLTKAAEWFSKSKDKEALYCLGEMNEFGKGIEENMKTAVELYVKAEEKGHVKAMMALGRM